MSARARATRALHALSGAAAFAVSACTLLLAFATPAWCGWQTFGLADGLANTKVTAIDQDHDENLWFGSAAGVSRYDGAAFQTFRVADGLINPIVQTIMTDRTGKVWIGTVDGVSRF